MHNSIVTAGHAVSPPVVVLVADPVAAIVTRGVAEPGRVVGVLGQGEILRVETEIVSTASPAWPGTVLVQSSPPQCRGLIRGIAGASSLMP